MKKYDLKLISDHDIYENVKATVLKYRFQIDLEAFNKNLLDPIKLTFDAKVYKKTIEAVLESEIIRQMDKSNTNHIAIFIKTSLNISVMAGLYRQKVMTSSMRCSIFMLK